MIELALAEFPRDGREYEVWWPYVVRTSARSGELEYQIELRDVASGKHHGRWVPFSHFGLLAIGSHWLDGQPLPSLARYEWIDLDMQCPMELAPVAKVRGDAGVWLGDEMRMTLKEPPDRVWRFYDVRGVEHLVCVHEVLRDNYLFDSRLHPSLLGGLIVHGKLATPSLQAWVPETRPWVDYPGGRARMTVSPDLDDRTAFRLARLVLTPEGRKGLTRLYWALKGSLMSATLGHRPPPWARLPPVGVPHAGQRLRWKAMCIDLPPNHDGAPRRLVRHIQRHDMPEPWTSIEISDGRVQRTRPAKHPSEGERGPTIEVLKALPRHTIDLTSEGSGQGKRPLRIAEVSTIDEQAEQYAKLPRHTAPPQQDVPAGKGTRQQSVPLNHAATGAATARSDVPTAQPGYFPGQGFPFQTQGGDLRPLLEELAKELHASGQADFFRFIPSRDEAYSFLLPPRGRSDPLPEQRPRLLLIFEIRSGDQFAYVVDPARSAGEHFPIAVAKRHDGRALDWLQIREVATALEDGLRRPGTWIAHERLRRFAHTIGIVHAPLGSLEMCAKNLELRLRTAVLALLSPNSPGE